MTSGDLIAQQEQRAVVTGTIIDSETGHPLDNAIVFLANTPIGTSSANDGTFRISFIPVGAFQMVIARVGYNREVMNLDVTKPESLYFEIKLKPQPVRTAGVEVYGERPAELKPNLTLFFPKETSDAYCIYGAANTMPIGIFFSDSAFYMYALDTAIVDSEKYIRLWLLYKNLSQTPYDIDPMKCAKLHIRGRLYSYNDLLPDPPSRVRMYIGSQDAIGRIVDAIGKPLLMTTKSVEFHLAEELRWILRSRGRHEKDSEFFNNNVRGSLSSVPLSATFTSSVNDGILVRHLVYPNNSVNGFVYFPFPGLNWKATASGFPEAAECVYTIEIIIQSGSKYIEFEPH